MSTTGLSLYQLLSEAIGDWIQVNTTANILAGTNVNSTTLNERDYAKDDAFKNRWLYFSTSTNNSGVERKVSDYFTSGGVCNVYGSNLVFENTAATFELGRYEHAKKLKVLSRAVEQIYPSLYKPLEDRSLVTGSILPDGHFDRWPTTSTMTFFTPTANATISANTTAGLYRGQRGGKSMNTNVSAADGYAYISSNTYPRLLDLMNKDVDFKAWAYPSKANDAFLTIAYENASGTETTVNSTTACPASVFTLLEIEDQAIPDNITKLSFRFRVNSSGENVNFDAARVNGMNLYEYLLPEDFQDGTVSEVWIQTLGYSDDLCDDLYPRSWERVYGWQIIDDPPYKYIRLPYLYTNNRQIRLIGHCPLETLTADTSTIGLEGEYLNLIIAYAAHLLFEGEKAGVSGEDKSRFEEESAYWWNKYRSLSHLRMATPKLTMNLPPY